MVQINENLN